MNCSTSNCCCMTSCSATRFPIPSTGCPAIGRPHRSRLRLARPAKNSTRGKIFAALSATRRHPNAHACEHTRHRFRGAASHSHYLQAALMHLSGRDHTCLTDRFRCRDFRLTGVLGEVVEGVLA